MLRERGQSWAVSGHTCLCPCFQKKGRGNEVVTCDAKARFKGAGPQVSLWTRTHHSAKITAEFSFSNLWRVLVLHSLLETTSRKHSRKLTLLCWRSWWEMISSIKKTQAKSGISNVMLWGKSFVKKFSRICVRKLWSGQEEALYLPKWIRIVFRMVLIH